MSALWRSRPVGRILGRDRFGVASRKRRRFVPLESHLVRDRIAGVDGGVLASDLLPSGNGNPKSRAGSRATRRGASIRDSVIEVAPISFGSPRTPGRSPKQWASAIVMVPRNSRPLDGSSVLGWSSRARAYRTLSVRAYGPGPPW